jgi:hypothetical protein
MGDQKHQALGYSQGGFSTKVHIRSEGGGKPMVFFLSEGQRNEMVGFWALMESGEVKRSGRRGRPRLRPRRICADKGYAKGVVRHYLRRLGIRITIARRNLYENVKLQAGPRRWSRRAASPTGR